MKSYFFVPAKKLIKLSFIKSFNVDDIIIDFEDSVLENERKELFQTLVKTENYKKYWFRIPVRNCFDEDLDFSF